MTSFNHVGLPILPAPLLPRYSLQSGPAPFPVPEGIYLIDFLFFLIINMNTVAYDSRLLSREY